MEKIKCSKPEKMKWRDSIVHFSEVKQRTIVTIVTIVTKVTIITVITVGKYTN